MNNISRKCCAIFREENSFSISYVLFGCFSRSRGNFAGRFARRKLFVWFVTNETSGARHRARWNAKRFRITTPGESRYIFFKASPAPYQWGPRGRERGGRKTTRGSERQREKGRAPIWNRYLHRFSNIFTFTTRSFPCPLPPNGHTP